MNQHTLIKALRLRSTEGGGTLSRFCRHHDLDVSAWSRLENGIYRAGRKVQERAAMILNTPEDDLFDPKGWPRLIGEAPNV